MRNLQVMSSACEGAEEALSKEGGGISTEFGIFILSSILSISCFPLHLLSPDEDCKDIDHDAHLKGH